MQWTPRVGGRGGKGGGFGVMEPVTGRDVNVGAIDRPALEEAYGNPGVSRIDG